MPFEATASKAEMINHKKAIKTKEEADRIATLEFGWNDTDTDGKVAYMDYYQYCMEWERYHLQICPDS